MSVVYNNWRIDRHQAETTRYTLYRNSFDEILDLIRFDSCVIPLRLNLASSRSGRKRPQLWLQPWRGLSVFAAALTLVTPAATSHRLTRFTVQGGRRRTVEASRLRLTTTAILFSCNVLLVRLLGQLSLTYWRDVVTWYNSHLLTLSYILYFENYRIS